MKIKFKKINEVVKRSPPRVEPHIAEPEYRPITRAEPVRPTPYSAGERPRTSFQGFDAQGRPIVVPAAEPSQGTPEFNWDRTFQILKDKFKKEFDSMKKEIKKILNRDIDDKELENILYGVKMAEVIPEIKDILSKK